MLIELTTVEAVEQIGHRIYLLKVNAPQISALIKPGQFCNIKVSDSDFPLLRRPFSICDVEGDSIFFMLDVVGEGTKILSEKKVGDTLDVLGPLGNGFDYDGEYKNAIIVAGGIGAAPFPFLYKFIENKNIITLLGARSSEMIIKVRMKNIFISTDDGSEGFKGTVLDLMKSKLSEIKGMNLGAIRRRRTDPLKADCSAASGGESYPTFSSTEVEREGGLNLESIRIFACGPNPMLKALQELALQNKYDCQISIESVMACGFGICMGCPVEPVDDGPYKLICKDGPVFNVGDIRL